MTIISSKKLAAGGVALALSSSALVMPAVASADELTPVVNSAESAVKLSSEASGSINSSKFAGSGASSGSSTSSTLSSGSSTGSSTISGLLDLPDKIFKVSKDGFDAINSGFTILKTITDITKGAADTVAKIQDINKNLLIPVS